MTSPITGVTPIYPGATGGSPTGYTYGYDPAGPSSAISADQLSTGQESMPRSMMTNGAALAPTSQQLRLTFFTARRSETSTQIRVYTGSTAAAATPTLCRIGLYLIDSAGDGSLVASTANDTTLFAATSTAYTKSWSSSYAMIAGQRYAWGPLVVSATTMPVFVGHSIFIAAESTSMAPTMSAALNSQANLPSSFTAASLLTSGQRAYAVILP